MNSYKPLFRKDIWTFKNYILEIKNDKKRLIIYLLYIFWIGSILISGFSKLNKNKSDMSVSIGSEYIAALITFIGIFILMYNLYKGLNESSTFFSMGDVNVLFQSPISSKKILLYHMIKQSIINFFIYGIVILALLPTLGDLVNIEVRYLGFMYLGYISFLLLIEPLKFLMFTLITKYKIESFLSKMIYSLLGLIIVYIIYHLVKAEDLLKGIIKAMNAYYINYIPIIGWAKSAFMTAIYGYSSWSLIALILQFTLLALLVFISYNTANDYYEDVLSATNKRELRKKRKKGLKKRKNFFLFTKKGKVNVKSKRKGPWAFMWRAKVYYKRTDIHPYFSILTIFSLIVGLTVGYFTRNTEGIIPMYIANGVIAYIMFLMSSVYVSNHELTKPYIYLIPGTYIEKIIAMNLVDIIRMTVNAFMLNIALGLTIKASLVTIISLGLFLTSFYILTVFANFLVRIIFPNTIDHKTLFPLFFMLQILLMLIPGAIIGGIVATLTNALGFFIGVTVTNFIIVAILILLSSNIFERLEWK
ncbi:MAG: hypothetical protein FH753_04220 [Firmicutes bacterium]|nr:hypothetical protein [Bacillota bacterium]